jgi:G-patch domain
MKTVPFRDQKTTTIDLTGGEKKLAVHIIKTKPKVLHCKSKKYFHFFFRANFTIFFCNNRAIPVENKGFKMLSKLGWTEGQSLGKSDTGIKEPVIYSRCTSNEKLVNFFWLF